MAQQLYSVKRICYHYKKGVKMKRKVQQLLEDLVKEISRWNTVDTITVAEPADDDLLSPYFFLSVDVFYRNSIPTPEERLHSFESATLFESSNFGTKDRFFIQGIPIRLEYKNMDRIEALLKGTESGGFVSREAGTYLYYRLIHNKKLFHRSPWLNKMMEMVTDLPGSFWIPLKKASWSNLEHQLSDLGTSVMAEDEYFFLQSLASYTRTLCSLLFILNREFEPAGRRMQEQVGNLPLLPENFKGRFASLVREDSEYTPERKLEVAKLIARSLITLV